MRENSDYFKKGAAVGVPAAGDVGLFFDESGALCRLESDGSIARVLPSIYAAAPADGIDADNRPPMVIPSNGTINLCGDSLTAGNGYAGVNFFQHSMYQRFIAYCNFHFLSGAMKPPTFVNSAVGGQSSAQMLSAVVAQVINPAVDGSDIIIQIGINDAGLLVTADAYAANIRGIMNAVVAARPNSRVHLVSQVWPFAERWSRTGPTVIGIDTPGHEGKDALVRAYNSRLRTISKEYTNCRFYDIYNDFFQWASVANTLNTGAFSCQNDGVHPSLLAGVIYSQCLFRRMNLATRSLPRWLMPLANADFNEGDWFQEQHSWMSHVSHGLTRFPVQQAWNRSLAFSCGLGRFPTTTPGGSTAAAGVADANVEGGGYTFTTAGLAFMSPTIYQAPKTTPFGISFQGSVNALAANRVALLGLGDSTAGGGSAAAPAGDALLVGIDQAFSATKFVVWEVRAGAVTKTATTLNADALDHTIHIQMNGVANDGNPGPRYAVYIDGQFVLSYQQASANFPQNPVAVGVGWVANGGTVTLKRWLARFAETITAATSPDGK